MVHAEYTLQKMEEGWGKAIGEVHVLRYEGLANARHLHVNECGSLACAPPASCTLHMPFAYPDGAFEVGVKMLLFVHELLRSSARVRKGQARPTISLPSARRMGRCQCTSSHESERRHEHEVWSHTCSSVAVSFPLYFIASARNQTIWRPPSPSHHRQRSAVPD